MRIKKMFALLIALLITFILPMQANAVSSDTEIMNYLQTYSKEIITGTGDTVTLSYDLDQLTEDEIAYIVDYISQVGISRFEEDVFGDTSQIEVQKNSSAIASRSLISKYVDFPYSGTQKYPNSEYVLISLGSGHTMEYTEDIAATYTVTKTIYASVGTISVPIAEYSTMTSASLLLLRN